MPMMENNYDTHSLQTEGATVCIVEYACWSIGVSGLKGAQEDGQHHLHKGAVHFYTSLHPDSTTGSSRIFIFKVEVLEHHSEENAQIPNLLNVSFIFHGIQDNHW